MEQSRFCAPAKNAKIGGDNVAMRQQGLRAATLGLGLTVLGFLLPGAALAADYTVKVNGAVVSGTMAEIRDGQLMVAVRPFTEALGARVDWDAADKRATIVNSSGQTAFWLGSHTSFQNGRQLWSPVKPYLKQGSTMVPAWFLAVRLGAGVSFDGTTLYVDLKDLKPAAQTTVVADKGLAQSYYYFPFPAGADYETYYDTMGASRFWDGTQFGHEGTDIVAPKWTPVVAVASGKVVRYGWNTLGGYRVTVELDDFPGYRFYYAHLSGYAPGLYEGAHVKAGQVLGYVGSTGEGPEGTEGKFVDHLHFGIYGPDWSAINSYPYLKYWENHKVDW